MKSHKRKRSTEAHHQPQQQENTSAPKKSKRYDTILSSNRSAFEEHRYTTIDACPECVICSPQHEMVISSGGRSPFDTACEASSHNGDIVMYKLLRVKSKHNNHTTYVHKSCAKETKLNLTVDTDNKSCQKWFTNIYQRVSTILH